MISVIELKRCLANADILSVVVCKLRYRKKLCPIILLEVDKSSKIGFYCIILPLSLAVDLWMEDSK